MGITELKTREDFEEVPSGEPFLEEYIARETKEYRSFLEYLAQDYSFYDSAVNAGAVDSVVGVKNSRFSGMLFSQTSFFFGRFGHALLRLVAKGDSLAEDAFGGREQFLAFLNRRSDSLERILGVKLAQKMGAERNFRYFQEDSIRYTRFAMLELDDLPHEGRRFLFDFYISNRFKMLELD